MEVSTMSDEQSTAAAEEYSRELEGRGQGDGRWLEYQLARALKRWGYKTAMRETVYGLEVDVVATRAEPRNSPTDWLLAECKDWESRLITPDVIYRLCMLAFTSRAMPVLCHTTSLTERAREIARRWEVRVLTLEDLHRGALPAPNVSAPIADLCLHQQRYTARERRGSLPAVLFYNRERTFTYVPGFEPVGQLHEYRPVKAEPDAAETGDE